MKLFENIICDYAFYFSTLLFLCWYHGEYVKHKAKKGNVYNDSFITGDIEYIIDDRLKTLYTMYETITLQAEDAQEKIDRINYLNKYGSVVNEKSKRRAENELYRIQQRKISIENQLKRLM